jgi:DNA-binding transcriptional ArsR family regulator
MSRPFEDLAGLDRLIHEPARLSILTALSACESVDFLFLQRLTGLTKGNLSGHLSKLEGAGLVAIEKAFVGRKPRTTLKLMSEGREAIDRHWKRLDALRKQTQGLKIEQPHDNGEDPSSTPTDDAVPHAS